MKPAPILQDGIAPLSNGNPSLEKASRADRWLDTTRMPDSGGVFPESE